MKNFLINKEQILEEYNGIHSKSKKPALLTKKEKKVLQE